ncbi:hypothetical protein EV174_003635 [Coemansia sp. RSA 2320]|nr:hypothetical protein EV174_003635 [Coemansia sp. RSA 2320]
MNCGSEYACPYPSQFAPTGMMNSGSDVSTMSAAAAAAAGERRMAQSDKDTLAILTMTSLGAVGGMLAGKAFSGGKNKSSRPYKSSAQNASSSPYLETSYTQYTHGNNVNAQLKPVTYDTYKPSSVLAQAGSSKSQSTQAPMPSSRHRLQTTLSHSQDAHAHPHAGLGSGASPHNHNGTASNNSSNSNINVGAESNKDAWKRRNQHKQSAAAVANTSYQAFDYSAGPQPLTSSVLAFNSAAAMTQPHQHKKSSESRRHSRPQLVANTSAASKHAMAGAINSPLTARPHDASSSDARPHTGNRKHQHRPHHVASATGVPGIAPSVLAGDVASAGFTAAPSKYNTKKQTKAGPSAPPPIQTQPLVAGYVPQPPGPQHPVSGPVYQQPLPATYQAQQPHQHQPQYGPPQPIPVHPQQAPAAPYEYSSFISSIAPPYSAQPLGLPYAQPPGMGHNQPAYSQQNQYQHPHQHPQASMSSSYPATYSIHHQPQGLASSYQYYAPYSPQAMQMSSESNPPARPKKHVHFAQ